MTPPDTQPLAAPAAPARAVQPPASVVPVADGLIGLAGLALVWALVLWLRPPLLLGIWSILLGTALPMLGRELRLAPPTTARREAVSLLLWGLGFAAATVPFFLVHAQAGRALFWPVAWAIVAPAFAIGSASKSAATAGSQVDFRPRLGAHCFRSIMARSGALLSRRGYGP
jgi:hypothetical protein